MAKSSVLENRTPFGVPRNAFKINYSLEDFLWEQRYESRRLYLYGAIEDSTEAADNYGSGSASIAHEIIQMILRYNTEDREVSVENRRPIIIYIDSPGGDITEGFALVSAIKASVTPVYTVNIGQWASMAFLIGITGAKRYSLKRTPFLLHDGATGFFGTVNKAQDTLKFNERFENDVVRSHVLECTKISPEQYDTHKRVEWYMLPEDALKYGCIDEIVETLDSIL